MSADPVRQSFGKPACDPKWPIEELLAPFHPPFHPWLSISFKQRVLLRWKEWSFTKLRERTLLGWKQRKLLRRFGFRQSFLHRVGPPLLLLVTIGIALYFLARVLATLGKPGATSPDLANVATALVAVGVFTFGYFQWRSARYEKSMEDFYSRLNLANHRRENTKLVSTILGHPWALNDAEEDYEFPNDFKDHQWSMYVYSELDNLEYVVENYNLGYMQARHAIRGLRTFYQRCIRKPFSDRACKCVRCMGYNDSTIRVVEEVCKDIERRRKDLRLPESQVQDSKRTSPWTKAAL